MEIQEERIRILFGLKVRQFRQDKGWSQAELSKRCGLSVSYLNEIEKGKKYPKANKMVLLADALGKSFEQLVNLKSTKELALVQEVLNAPIWEELPLETFGLELGKIIELLAFAPTKANAFVSTLFDVLRRYSITREQFNLIAVRSFLEIQANYFPEIESEAALFLKKYKISRTTNPIPVYKRILEVEYGYTFAEIDQVNFPELAHLRSVFVPGSVKKLVIKPGLDDNQTAFILAREIAFNRMAIEKRPHTFTWVKVGSFDEMLNNAKASYFSGAVLIPESDLTKDIAYFLGQETWKNGLLLQLMLQYTNSAETFMYRLTNLLPKHFGINSLFFLRFTKQKGTDEFTMDKELHLSRLHNPYRNASNEHFCRRWVSITAMQELEASNGVEALAKAQVSIYPNGNKYFVFTITKPVENSNLINSFSIGLEWDKSLINKIGFAADKNIPKVYVGESCENCPISDCSVRQVEPINLQL